jgi:hypothetical protein
MTKSVVSVVVALSLPMAPVGHAAEPLSALFDAVGLTPEQRTAVNGGHPVAKVLSWGKSSEVYVFGAIHIDGSPATYLKASRNVTGRKGTQGFLGGGEIPAGATEADLSALTLDPDDIKALKSCREGDCDVQLPTSSIQAFRDAINWSEPTAVDDANALARKMVIGLLEQYQRGGNAALGVYRDKQNPALVTEQFKTMMSRAELLPDLLPELRRYLLEYPTASVPGADSFFYWEQIDFGMKPTLRVNHGVLYHSGEGTSDVSVVAIKQLYASHYFHTALDVSVCVSDATRADRPGFYLVTLKGSEQDGLTGVRGSMLRRIVVDKTRSGLEKALGAIKASVEVAR